MTIARLDSTLVERGLARSRGDARDLILGGHVSVDGRPARRVSAPVDRTSRVEVDPGAPRWVGRAAVKLAAALDLFRSEGLDARGRRCLDVGASTGGFSEVLLRAGAAHVIALDVGTGQLAAEIAADPRVEDRSGTTIRGLRAEDIGGPVDLVVADLSFISLTLVIPTIADLVRESGDVVLLVKPQFEVGRAALGKRGVVRSAEVRRAALLGVMDAAESAGLHPRGVARSPVRGGEGNIEYLLWAAGRPAVGHTWEALRASAGQVDDGGGPSGGE